MSNTFKVATPLVVGTLTADPGTAENGTLYYNSSTGKFRSYQGGAWGDTSSATLAQFNVFVGNASSVPTAVNTNSVGDIKADSTNGFTIKNSVIVDAQVAAAAAIALTKLAALTNHNRALQSDSSGFISESSVTSTELGYVSGVTSAIQTQLNAKLSLSGGTMSGSINGGGFEATNFGDPTAAQSLTTKSYVDGKLNGLGNKFTTRATTTAALAANTYANGTAGVGATLTANANGALAAQDGVTLVANDRLLVQNEVSGLKNGIYVVTQVGSGGTPYILTRATDADSSTSSPAKVAPDMFVFVSEGTTLSDTGWVLSTDAPITMGTTALTFVQFSGAGTIIAGTGLTKTGNTISLTALTANRAVVTNGTGYPTAATTTDTEIGYVNGVTSAIQTQLNAKASTDLSNLAATTAVNNPILPGTDNSLDFGSSSKRWLNVFGRVMDSGASDLTLKANAGSNSLQVVSTNLKRGASTSRFVNEIYTDAITLSGSQSGVAISAFTVAFATIDAQEICYRIKDGTSNAIRVGTIRVVTDGTNTSITDVFTETADAGVTWSAAINGSNLEVRVTTTANTKTMRADIKQFLL